MFKELVKLGYEIKVKYTVDQLDELPIDHNIIVAESGLILKWIREKFNIDISAHPDTSNRSFYCYTITRIENKPFWTLIYNTGKFGTHERATYDGIVYAITYLLTKTKKK